MEEEDKLILISAEKSINMISPPEATFCFEKAFYQRISFDNHSTVEYFPFN